MKTRRLLSAILMLLLLAGCKPSEESQLKAIIGGVLIDGTGGPPVSDAVIVVAGTRIRAAGPRASTPIPAGSEKTDARGKFIVPGLIDLSGTELPEVTTLEQVEKQVDAGATVMIGIVTDTRDIDAGYLRKLRDLQAIFAPRLEKYDGPVARENVKKLSDAGIRLAVAAVKSMHQELKLMGQAGLTPSELLMAVTRNGAAAIGKKDELGTIEPGKRADLLVLDANPLEEIANLRKVSRRMAAGHWQEFRKK